MRIRGLCLSSLMLVALLLASVGLPAFLALSETGEPLGSQVMLSGGESTIVAASTDAAQLSRGTSQEPLSHMPLDDGSDWTAMESGTTAWLYGVWGSSSNDVFAVGWEGTIVHYDGTRWEAMDSGTGASLMGIWGSSSHDVFAVGQSGTILHYDGTNWNYMESGTTKSLNGVWGSSDANVYVVGGDWYDSVILRYDGSQWTQMRSSASGALYDVWGSSGSGIFAVGDAGVILHYNGSSWSSMYSGTTQPIHGIHGTEGDRVFAACGSRAFGVVLHYDGAIWRDMRVDLVPTLSGIWSTADAAFAVGEYGNILQYDGHAWGPMNSGSTAWLNDVWGSGQGDVFAVGVEGTILRYRETVTGVVVVRNSDGSPVDQAQVFHNGTLAGMTAMDGSLGIPNLAVEDELVARLRIHEEPSPRNHHNQDSTQNWAYRVYITSMEILGTGDAHPEIVRDLFATQTLTLSRSNPLIGFNILAAVEWDANAVYLEELRQGMQHASAYLYNASNGQMLFERVSIYDNNHNMGEADYQIRASNQERPRAGVGGLLLGHDAYVFLGRHFSRSATGVGSAMSGSWVLPGGYSVIVHEFGHYGLFLWDSYLDVNRRETAHCTSASISTNGSPGTNATLMCHEFFATQFAMRGVAGLWSSDCEQTYQVYRNSGQSDWETIVDRYRDRSSPARWMVKTPVDYGAVVPGPTSIPVSAWSVASIGIDAATGVCDPSPTYEVLHLWGSPVRGAEVNLRTSNGTIDQGRTDDQGLITVLGASAGDRVIVNAWGLDLRINSFEVSCSSLLTAQNATPTPILLQPAPFDLTTSVLPGAVAYQAEVHVSAAVTLPAAPTAHLTQHGTDAAVDVPLTYDATVQAYTGVVTLTADLPQSGTLLAGAENGQQQVEVATTFILETVAQDQDVIMYSADGQAELYIPANTLSTAGVVGIERAQLLLTFPEGLHLLSGPYAIRGGDDLALIGDAIFSLRYLDQGDLYRFDTTTARIYRWDGAVWNALDTTVGKDHQIAAATVTAFGTYALLAANQRAIYLPLILH